MPVMVCDGGAGRQTRKLRAEERVKEYVGRQRTAAQKATMHKLEAREGCVMCVACGEYEYNNNNGVGQMRWTDRCGAAGYAGHHRTSRAYQVRDAKDAEKWTREEMWKLRLGLSVE